MPFHDENWEEWQRDCDIFPAYSDCLLGPDLRLVVTQEPGLHPVLYPAPMPQSIQYTPNVQSPSQNPRAMARSGLEITTLPRAQSASHRGESSDYLENDSTNKTRKLIDPPSFLQHPRTLPQVREQSRQQPCISTQTLPHSAAGPQQLGFPFSPQQAPQMVMLQPNDIVRDLRYQCIEPETRNKFRRYLSGLWHIANNTTDTGKKAKALADIRGFSKRVLQQIEIIEVGRGQQSPPHTPAHNQPEQTDERSRHMSTQSLYRQSAQPQAQIVKENHPSQWESQSAWQPPVLPHTEVIVPQVSTQLRVRINQYLPQVWYCLRTTGDKSEPISADDLHRRNRAQQWLTSFKTNLPAEGRPYVTMVLRWIYKEQVAGRDPLISLGHQK